MTPVHDHVTWCVAGVVAGTEHEELFELAGGRADGRLVQTVVRDNVTGSVSGFAPPGDIHRVRNATEQTAISIHVYGADISRLGSSDPALLRPARTRRSALTPTATGQASAPAKRQIGPLESGPPESGPLDREREFAPVPMVGSRRKSSAPKLQRQMPGQKPSH